jgi:hypothetical protein
MTSPKGRPTAHRCEVTLDGLHQLRQRIDDKQLEPDDWPLLGALVSKQIARAEQRRERMIAKIAAAQSAKERVADASSDGAALEASDGSS